MPGHVRCLVGISLVKAIEHETALVGYGADVDWVRIGATKSLRIQPNHLCYGGNAVLCQIALTTCVYYGRPV